MNHVRRLFVMLAVLCVGAAGAGEAQLTAALGQPTLLAGKKQLAYLKVGMTGFALEDAGQRTPVNIALVLDRSGSMQGEKLNSMKQAALEALDRLGPNDIAAVIAFDSTVDVVLPATKLSDKTAVRAAIAKIEAGGETALFAGVSKGAEELRKFLDHNRVNRIILLTDGIANVGPSTPTELGSLGASLKKEGICVTTLGIGLDYNEDLLVQLARRSDGNHAFIKTAADMQRIFQGEFGDVLKVVAQEIAIKIQCADGIRPVRVLGRESEISGQNIFVQMNQLYSNWEHFVIVELEVPATPEGQTREVAVVSASYANMVTHATDRLHAVVKAAFAGSNEAVERSEDKKVMESCVSMVANANNSLAVTLRDQGKIEDARQVLKDNVDYIRKENSRLGSEELKKWEKVNQVDSEKLDPEHWQEHRKEMKHSGSVGESQIDY